MDILALKSEIESDPKGIGYATHIRGGACGTIADLLNATTGPGAGTITLAWQRRDPFLTGLIGPLLVLATKDSATQAKWDRILATLRAAEWIDVSKAIQLLGLAQADGLIDDDGIAALTTRVGSRAEVLFGDGASVTYQQVAQALLS